MNRLGRASWLPVRWLPWASLSLLIHVGVGWGLSGDVSVRQAGPATSLSADFRSVPHDVGEAMGRPGGAASNPMYFARHGNTGVPPTFGTGMPSDTALVPVATEYATTEYFSDDGVDVPARPLGEVDLSFLDGVLESVPGATIDLILYVGKNGNVERVTLNSSGVTGVVEEQVIAVFSGMQFSPAIKDGTPVKYRAALQILHPEELAL